MKRIVETAVRIAQAEQDFAFMENVTLDLVAGDPNVPFTNMEFSCGVKKWYVRDVKQHVQELIHYNIPSMRVENTMYTPFDAPREVYDSFQGLPRDDTTGEVIGLPDYPLPDDAYYYFHMLYDLGISQPDMRVGFSYEPRWGMYFKAYPSHNGVMKSKNAKGGSQFLNFLCVDISHFVYDMVYPLQITITDTESFVGEGYTYSFFIPVQIQQNRAVRDDIGVTFFNTPDQERELCASPNGRPVSLRATSEFQGTPSEEILGANISMECVTDRCLLGTTESTGGHYQLNTKLPSECAYPYVIAEKEGYLSRKIQVLDNTEDVIEVPMQKLKKIPFEVVKHLYYDDTKTLLSAIPLEANENATISLSTMNGTFTQYVVYPINPEDPISQYLELVEDEGIIYKVDILGTKRGYAREYLFGGYSGNYTPSYDEIAQAQKIVFHIFEFRPTPIKDEDQFKIAAFLEGNDYQERLTPHIE